MGGTDNTNIGAGMKKYAKLVGCSINVKEYKYLAVADGWNSTRRFILYDEVDFVVTYGVSIKITK